MKMPGERRAVGPDRVACLAAPVIMCLVAAGQFYMAHTSTLTPWKGGGFGMFSSSDHPGARVLTSEGVTTEGEVVRVTLPLDGSVFPRSVGRHLKMMPTERLLERIGRRAIACEYLDSREQSERLIEEFRRRNPDAELAELQPDPRRSVRVRNPLDEVTEGMKTYRLRELHLQVWRLRFNAQEVSVASEPMVGPVTIRLEQEAGS